MSDLSLSQKFLEAMGIVVDQAVAQSNRDYTITGKITQNSPVNGKYYVQIAGQSDVKELNGVGSYIADEEVYILVPQGNMSGDKLVIGRKTETSSVAFQTEDEILERMYLYASTEHFSEKNGPWPINFLNTTTTLYNGPADAKTPFQLTGDAYNEWNAMLSRHNMFYAIAQIDVEANATNGLYNKDVDYSLIFTFNYDNNQELILTIGINDALGNPYDFNGEIKKVFEIDPKLYPNAELVKIEATSTDCATAKIYDLKLYSIADSSENWARSVYIVPNNPSSTDPDAGLIASGDTELALTAYTRYVVAVGADTSKLKYTWAIKSNYADISDGWKTLTTDTNSITLQSTEIISHNAEVRCTVSYDTFVLSDTIQIIDENWPQEDEWLKDLEINTDKKGEVKVTKSTLSNLYVRWKRYSPAGRPLALWKDNGNSVFEELVLVTQDTVNTSNALSEESATNFAYTLLTAELVLQENKIDIRSFDTDELAIDGKFPTIENYTTYYTAQLETIERFDLPGYSRVNNKWIFDPSNILIEDNGVIPSEKTKQDFWFADASETGWDKTNLNLWAVELLDTKTDEEDSEPYWTLPNIISVHPGPQYSIHLTNDNAFVIAEADGSTTEADFGENTTIEVKLFEDNVEFNNTQYQEWAITPEASDTISYEQAKDENGNPIPRTWEVTGFKSLSNNPSKTYDDGYINFTASQGNKTLTARFGISKIYKGANGEGLRGLTLSLDNDSDIIVRRPDGTMLSALLPVVKAGVYEGTQPATDGSNSIECYWNGNDNQSMEGTKDKPKTYDNVTGYFDKNNNTLTITAIGQGVMEGRFTFKSGALSKDFKFKVITSTVDYDFAFAQTVFNSTKGGQSCAIIVKKTDESGVKYLTSPEGSINVRVKGNTNPISNWGTNAVPQDTTTYEIYETINGKDFVWDEETIEIVFDGQNGADGSAAQDFNITASTYALTKDKNGNYTNIAILTAHKINLGDVTIKWTDSENKQLGEGDTYTVTEPGTYTATAGDWSDSVTIGEVVDGKNAIAIMLSNPSMTFHANTANKTETCEVIVYEGTTKLSYGDGKGKFTLQEKEDLSNKASYNNEIITIRDPVEKGSVTFTVTVITQDGTQTEQDLTINWIVVSNGTNGQNGVDSTWVTANPSEIILDSENRYSKDYIVFTARRGNNSFINVFFKIDDSIVNTTRAYQWCVYWGDKPEHDSIMTDGNGGFTQITPPEGGAAIDCSIYLYNTANAVALDTETIGIIASPKAIKEAIKLYCFSENRPVAPSLPNGNGSLTFDNSTPPQIIVNAYTWTKNDFDENKVDIPLWCVDYIEYTDGTASITSVVSTNEQKPTYDIVRLYCGPSKNLSGSSYTGKLPWPLPATPTWNGTATPIKSSKKVKLNPTDTAIEATWTWYESSEDITSDWVYCSEQTVFNKQYFTDAWSKPFLVKARGQTSGAVLQDYQLFLSAMSDNNGAEGIFSVQGGDGAEHTVINASMIRTGTLEARDGFMESIALGGGSDNTEDKDPSLTFPSLLNENRSTIRLKAGQQYTTDFKIGVNSTEATIQIAPPKYGDTILTNPRFKWNESLELSGEVSIRPAQSNGYSYQGIIRLPTEDRIYYGYSLSKIKIFPVNSLARFMIAGNSMSFPSTNYPQYAITTAGANQLQQLSLLVSANKDFNNSFDWNLVAASNDTLQNLPDYFYYEDDEKGTFWSKDLFTQVNAGIPFYEVPLMSIAEIKYPFIKSGGILVLNSYNSTNNIVSTMEDGSVFYVENGVNEAITLSYKMTFTPASRARFNAETLKVTNATEGYPLEAVVTYDFTLPHSILMLDDGSFYTTSAALLADSLILPSIALQDNSINFYYNAKASSIQQNNQGLIFNAERGIFNFQDLIINNKRGYTGSVPLTDTVTLVIQNGLIVGIDGTATSATLPPIENPDSGGDNEEDVPPTGYTLTLNTNESLLFKVVINPNDNVVNNLGANIEAIYNSTEFPSNGQSWSQVQRAIIMQDVNAYISPGDEQYINYTDKNTSTNEGVRNQLVAIYYFDDAAQYIGNSLDGIDHDIDDVKISYYVSIITLTEDTDIIEFGK